MCPPQTTCSSAPSLFESPTAERAARVASSEPSLASSILVGYTLISSLIKLGSGFIFHSLYILASLRRQDYLQGFCMGRVGEGVVCI